MASSKIKSPLVSVVITTKNEEKNIANCIESVLNQNYPKENIEVIVVDNESTDKTKSIARRYTRHVYTKGPERSAQRNYGLSTTSGEYLMYLDADMVLSPNVIATCVRKMKSDVSLAGLYISEIVSGNNYWSQVRRFERSFYDATVVDCVRFLSREAFLKSGGFDTSMTGPEDWDFDKKIRNIGKVDQVIEPIFHNESEFDIKKYLSKKSYYAKSFNAYINKWGKNDPDIKKQFGFSYRYLTVFFENGKWKNLIRSLHLLFGVYILRILVGVVYLSSRLVFKKS